MDDTGFFSVQVLENALQVWNMTLVPWRSEQMRLYHDHPHACFSLRFSTQLAFILNCNQHWYTLRRFGRVSPDPALEADPGGGHWFDLNSFLPEPHWIGKTFLGMVLQQAELEGYSVFAVAQINPTGPLALPRTEGDELAQTLGEPSEAAYQPYAPVVPQQLAAPTTHTGGHTDDFGFEDEDMELQAALQASLMGGGGDPYLRYDPGQPPQSQTTQGEHYNVQITTGASQAGQSSRYRVPVTAPPDPEEAYTQVRRGCEMLQADDNIEDDEGEVPAIQDPIAASRARAQALMEQARREQEAALRDNYEEEQARIRAGYPSRRNTRQEQEEAELQRAIEESRALHEAHMSRNSGSPDAMDADEEAYHTPREVSQSSSPAAAYHGTHRVYDDDDAELQAALRASLETVPEGFRIPSPPPRPQQPPAVAPPQNPPPSLQKSQDDHDVETESEAESIIQEDSPAEVSLDEIRRRRLARFGG
ncbi:hypothetical protein EIP86_005014 [Pleurotus ostreatoroseus]|nr:hypothetical protein EIP86_005014 [Pleurotus ostreatoroseus]